MIDTAKGVNILVSTETDDLKEHMGLEIVGRKLRSFIVIPSTSGTGSETTLVSVIADTSRNIKLEFISYSLLLSMWLMEML